jgi:cholesterol oxidase
MGRSAADGVCDSYGEVFDHPGLFVADGAAMPGPVGANPSLTIAAHADRLAQHILEQPGHKRRPSRQRPKPVNGRVVRVPARSGGGTSLAFTEEMKGYFAFDETDPERGARIGKARQQKLMFHLTITATDAERFITDPRHTATAAGYLESDSLGGKLPVETGSFNLFTIGNSPESRSMLYRLRFADGAGNPLTLSGRKDVRPGPLSRVWPDTSTLYYRILEGHADEEQDGDAAIVGAGILHILQADFVHQLTTFRTNGPQPAEALTQFGRFFLGQLWDVYGPHFSAATAALAPTP